MTAQGWLRQTDRRLTLLERRPVSKQGAAIPPVGYLSYTDGTDSMFSAYQNAIDPNDTSGYDYWFLAALVAVPVSVAGEWDISGMELVAPGYSRIQHFFPWPRVYRDGLGSAFVTTNGNPKTQSYATVSLGPNTGSTDWPAVVGLAWCVTPTSIDPLMITEIGPPITVKPGDQLVRLDAQGRHYRNWQAS